jgi:RNA polymerase sigma factor (sigma-70 family)
LNHNEVIQEQCFSLTIMMQIVKKPEIKSTIIHSCNPDQWVKRHTSYLFIFAMSRLHDKEQAKDLVQETFLAALENIEKFEHRCSERTWLAAILKNKIIDTHRKRETETAKLAGLSYAVQYQEMFSTHHELMPLLNRAMKKLPELWQAVFTMKNMEDQPTEVICRVLQLTLSNFWVITHRTRINLRASLHKYDL